MTMTVGAPPAHHTPADLASGFLTAGVIGASLTAFIGGCMVESAPMIAMGLVVPALYGLLFFLATLPRRASEAAVAPRTALAMIESREAVRGETTDVPVRFELSVVPDDAPAFRVEMWQDVNRVELSEYRSGGTVVVEYPPDRPWKTRILRRPTPQWEERAAVAQVDSVPGPTMRSETPDSSFSGFLNLFGLLLGVAAVLLMFRADLFDVESSEGDNGASPKPSVSSSSSSTTIVTSVTGTVAIGPGRSMLDESELRRAVASLTQPADKRHALTVVVQDRLLTIVFPPAGAKVSGFDPRSLPYDRVADLVEEARTTLNVDSPRTWQLNANSVTGPLTLRVVVTGYGGTGTLEADGKGEVLRRNGS
ncbi:hypothetical protein ABTY00_05865 [Streptomyces microflavus]|uniref:hypothetical protein n=1 Tax=Streptomyces microflavus TaxID=1919 RepID=UPI0033191AA5